MTAAVYPVTHDRRVASRERPVRRAPIGPGTYARRRAAAAAAFAVLVALAAAAVLGLLGGGPLATPEISTPRGFEPVAVQTHVVQPGDTLWSIARRAQPAGDVRRLVDRLADAHGGGPLQVGERIVLP